MLIYYSTFLFLISIALASFFNALLFRIDNKYKYPEIFTQGSHCEKCKKQLNWHELIPVFSYILYRGKCRKCGYSVPLYYPLSELFLGLGLVAVYITQSPPYFYILILFLFVMSYFDRLYHGIPKVIVHLFLIFSVINLLIYLIQGTIPDIAIITSVLISLSIYIVGKILKKPFGFGDILVLLGLGLLLSPIQYIIFIYMLLILSFVYVILFLIMKKITIKSKIPLLPFMFASVVLTLLTESILSPILSNYML